MSLVNLYAWLEFKFASSLISAPATNDLSPDPDNTINLISSFSIESFIRLSNSSNVSRFMEFNCLGRLIRIVNTSSFISNNKLL